MKLINAILLVIGTYVIAALVILCVNFSRNKPDYTIELYQECQEGPTGVTYCRPFISITSEYGKTDTIQLSNLQEYLLKDNL